MRLTPAQKRVLTRLSAGQSVQKHEYHVAWRLQEHGLLRNGKCSVTDTAIYTYYDLTDAGRAALAGTRKARDDRKDRTLVSLPRLCDRAIGRRMV